MPETEILKVLTIPIFHSTREDLYRKTTTYNWRKLTRTRTWSDNIYQLTITRNIKGKVTVNLKNLEPYLPQLSLTLNEDKYSVNMETTDETKNLQQFLEYAERAKRWIINALTSENLV